MSFGHSSNVRFDVNHGGAPGIFWQKGNPKTEKRKFGYKSKNLRHDIRRPDNTDAIEEMERRKEEEKMKFNSENKDFIQKNRERYRPREQVPPSGSTHIGPGTVTLTQDQLASLLASLSAMNKGENKSDNPLKISFDANTNQIEVERFESDNGESGDEGKDDRDKRESGGKSPALGVYDLIDGGDVISRNSSKEKKHVKKTEKELSRKERGHTPAGRKEDGGRSSPVNNTRSSLDLAKEEAGVAHISPRVPLKHMTVGERKRLQWAMERAELEKEYDPWGRPGAGAPPAKMYESKRDSPRHQQQEQPVKNTSSSENKGLDLKAKRQQEREDLESDIERLRREIQEAEKQKEEEEQNIIRRLLEEEHKKAKRPERGENGKDTRPEKSKKEDDGKRDGKQERRKKQRDSSQHRNDDSTNNNSEKTNDGKAGDMEEQFLSKKEIDRRKWVAELNQQREEQRMRKQQEREQDKASIHDQWADRFVYHKSGEQTSPRRGQEKSRPREEASVLGKAKETRAEVFDAPPAMRSSIVVGAGTLNETRFDSKKADEKRQWLEELDRQREEKRQYMAAMKEKERQEDGVWADRYPSERQKINQFSNTQLQASPRSKPMNVESPRVSSAPEPAAAVSGSIDLRDSQDQPSTYLRGQGVYVDPVTRKEQEEKRRLHLEYQAEIKAQIEEKERLKREERDRKAREDMEEERKLQMERDRVKKQEEAENRKVKDREMLQQKQLAALKSAMEEAQEKATEEKNLRRIHHLQQRGHDVSHLKATYNATTPRVKEYNAAVLPGLGQGDISPLPSEQVFVPAHPTTRGGGASPSIYNVDNQRNLKELPPMSQSYSKDPYTEDRVLTPSRLRNPSKPRDDPNSPRREFGTQTLELKDLQSILSSLPDDIQIEYKMKVEEALKEKQEKKQEPSRKVHSKSADAKTGKTMSKTTGPRREIRERAISKDRGVSKERAVSKERPQKINERPQWNQRKAKNIVKNSEKDPFYQQRKEESEARKARRERQLQYLQELNKERIPNLSPTRAARAASPDNSGHQGGDRGREQNPKKGRPSKLGSNQRSNSPDILTLINDNEPKNRKVAGRSSSPPVPTVKHKTTSRNDYGNEDDAYFYTNSVLKNSQTGDRYEDLKVAKALPIHEGEFVPFTRTTEILDPARADEPLAISRENSRMERARKAYRETRHPAQQGRPLNVLQDRERESALRGQTFTTSNNPILNPNLVTDHPTERQDKILQQLSSLKQNLMQRRKELENFMSPTQFES